MRTGKLTYFVTALIFLFFASMGTDKTSLSMPPTNGKIDAIKVYRNNCQKCHGEDGKGTTRGKVLGAPDFTDANWQVKMSDAEIVAAITDGKNKMPSWKGELTAQEIMAAGRYVRSFASKKR